MLDWYFIIMLITAIIFLILSIEYEGDPQQNKNGKPFWSFMFLIWSTSLWFILALINLDIETFYPSYNSTTGTTTPMYDLYANEPTIYISYFFGLIAVMCIIYMIIKIFGSYYESIDNKEKKGWEGTED